MQITRISHDPAGVALTARHLKCLNDKGYTIITCDLNIISNDDVVSSIPFMEAPLESLISELHESNKKVAIYIKHYDRNKARVHIFYDIVENGSNILGSFTGSLGNLLLR